VDNAGATFKPSEHKWLWSSAAFPAGETKTVVYNLTVPSDATAQDYYLSGVIKNSSGIIGNVAGETKITVTTITEIHDINVTWIKVLKDTTEIPEGDNLTIGKTYKIRYRVNNDGNFDEPEVNITVKLANDTWETTLREHTTSINAGSGGTYTITSWDTTGLTAGVYTITVNASIADDANPADNERTREVVLETVTPVINGYKGKRYTGGADIKTVQNLTINGNVLYSVGDSYYMGGSTAWETYTANWTASDLPVPAGATIVKARLYVYYTWDKVQGMPDNVSLTFNGNPKTRDAFYTDRKGFGSYDYPSGMLAYDVTADFDASGNTAVLENRNPVAGNPSIYGMLLVVIYEKTGEMERTIWLNEECDILQARDDYNVSSTEATAFAPFAGTIDTDNVLAATLITVVPSGADGDDKNRLYFNTGEWHGIWDGFAGSTQLGINETDVTDYLSSTDNLAKLQSNIPTGETKGDYMVATNAILVVGYFDPADTDHDRKVSMPELMTAIGWWKHSTYPDYGMPELMTTIARWKAGSY